MLANTVPAKKAARRAHRLAVLRETVTLLAITVASLGAGVLAALAYAAS